MLSYVVPLVLRILWPYCAHMAPLLHLMFCQCWFAQDFFLDLIFAPVASNTSGANVVEGESAEKPAQGEAGQGDVSSEATTAEGGGGDSREEEETSMVAKKETEKLEGQESENSAVARSEMPAL